MDTMQNRKFSWLLLAFCYLLTCSRVAHSSNTLWELNLAKFGKFSAKSSSYPSHTTIATLQSSNGSLSLEIVWDFSRLAWQVSIVQVGFGSLNVCHSRGFHIHSNFDSHSFILRLKESKNLMLTQGNSLLWESQSCNLHVSSLRITNGSMLKALKSKADNSIKEALAQNIIGLAYRRALQDRNLAINQNGGHRNKKALAMEIVFPVAAFLLCALCLVLVCTRRRKVKANQIKVGNTTQKSRLEEDEVLLKTLASGLPPRFTYAEMQEATNGFQKKLGEGGYGAVYEGALPQSGFKIAVKVFLDPESKTCRKGFCAEVMSIGEKKHSNLVQLRGFCVEDDHRMLVYELMENGSLNRVLFGAKADQGPPPLSWERRKAIAIDTARALAFLHEEGEEKPPVIHCDVKPENILLNEKWVAKVSDFGLAKLMWAAKGHVGHEEEGGGAEKQEGDGKANGKQKPSGVAVTEITSRMSQLSGLKGVRGTLGYVAPEWTSGEGDPEHAITTASDVYSFGVVLLELVAGRRCMVPGHPFLPGLAFDMLKDGRDLSNLLDPHLQQGMALETSTPLETEDVQKSVNVALWCLQEDLALRPTMVDVLAMLTDKKSTLSPPFCDYFDGSSHFFDEGENHNHNHLFSDSTSGFRDKELETSSTSSLDPTSCQVSILSGR